MNIRRISLTFVCGLFAALPGLGQEVQGLVIPFKTVTISSPVQDIIKRVWVEEGDQVKEGQVVANLSSDKEELDVEQYKKVAEGKEFDTLGVQKLYQEHIGSKDVALEKQTDLELARIQLKVAEVRLNDKTIRSPLSGIVVKKYKETGEGVDRVEKMFDIINIDQVYIQFYLDPKYLGTLKTGEKIAVRFPTLKNKENEGTISFVDPRIDAASGLFRVKLLLENPNHEIKAGMRGEADFSKP